MSVDDRNEEVGIRELKGYSDCGKQHLRCEGCGKHLMDVWVVDDSIDKTTKVKANCCYCDDSSVVKAVEGKFFFGIGEDSVGVIAPDSMDEDIIVFEIVAKE